MKLNKSIQGNWLTNENLNEVVKVVTKYITQDVKKLTSNMQTQNHIKNKLLWIMLLIIVIFLNVQISGFCNEVIICKTRILKFNK